MVQKVEEPPTLNVERLPRNRQLKGALAYEPIQIAQASPPPTRRCNRLSSIRSDLTSTPLPYHYVFPDDRRHLSEYTPLFSTQRPAVEQRGTSPDRRTITYITELSLLIQILNSIVPKL